MIVCLLMNTGKVKGSCRIHDSLFIYNFALNQGEPSRDSQCFLKLLIFPLSFSNYVQPQGFPWSAARPLV